MSGLHGLLLKRVLQPEFQANWPSDILGQRDQKDYAGQNTVEPVKPTKCGLHIAKLSPFLLTCPDFLRPDIALWHFILWLLYQDSDVLNGCDKEILNLNTPQTSPSCPFITLVDQANERSDKSWRCLISLLAFLLSAFLTMTSSSSCLTWRLIDRPSLDRVHLPLSSHWAQVPREALYS